MKARIAKRAVDQLQPGQSIADTEIRGFIARRLPSGALTYGYRYRDRAGQQRWLPLGLHGSITADEARILAKKRAGEVADNRDPAAERKADRATEANTVNAVLDSFVTKHVRGQGLRTADTIERTFERLIRPRLGTKSIYDVQRRDVVDLLDKIEEECGPVMADRALAHLRKCFNWFATRDDRFVPPIVIGMMRTKPRERARSRTLDDQEIGDLWQALDELTDAPPRYAAFIRVALLTGQRRSEIAGMHRDEISGTKWTIPADRYKTRRDHEVPLTAAVQKIVGEGRGFIFSSDVAGKRALSGYSKAQGALVKKLADVRKRDGRKPMPHWTPHDLRRTARSLMSRCGVSSDIAERTLGHALAGVRNVYDRHAYFDEKRDALERLAALVERIITPTDAAVLPFKAKR
jgi:integrase